MVDKKLGCWIICHGVVGFVFKFCSNWTNFDVSALLLMRRGGVVSVRERCPRWCRVRHPCLENGANTPSSRSFYYHNHANSPLNPLPSLLSIQGPLIICLIAHPFSCHFLLCHNLSPSSSETQKPSCQHRENLCGLGALLSTLFTFLLLKVSLLSVSCLGISGHHTVFVNKTCTITSRADRRTIPSTQLRNGLYLWKVDLGSDARAKSLV